LHEWLVAKTKIINSEIKSILQGTKEHMDEIQFEFVFDFFEKCCSLMEQNCKYLAQALIDCINKKIDVVHLQSIPTRNIPEVQGIK
jgi:hypothetical protein